MVTRYITTFAVLQRDGKVKVYLNARELQQVHDIQLEMLNEVHRICCKYKIKYIISGGTLLGAVRHKGFIPWDDDIDIRMERNEYDKFCNIVVGEPDSKQYFFQTYKTDKNYPWFYAKLRYKASKYVRCGQEHLKIQDGIFIDIMPADGVPNSILGRQLMSCYCYILKKVLYSAVGCRSEGNMVKRLFYSILNLFPKSLVFLLLESSAKKYSSRKYRYVTCYSFVKWNQKEYTKRLWHLKRVRLAFEGKK